MRSSLLQAILAASWLAGCSPSAFRAPSDPGRERLDVLTSFTLALSKRDYRAAAAYLAPADRAKLAGPEGILPEYRERVRAIRRSTLLNNPLIEVGHGRISGIPEVLPVWGAGAADGAVAENPADTVPEANGGEAFATGPDGLPGDAARAGQDARDREELKQAANAFFRAVSRRDWAKAMGYMADQEREDFLDAKGGVRPAARQRLAAVDTAGWEALTLRDGKLTGVVLIIPPKPGERAF